MTGGDAGERARTSEFRHLFDVLHARPGGRRPRPSGPGVACEAIDARARDPIDGRGLRRGVLPSDRPRDRPRGPRGPVPRRGQRPSRCATGMAFSVEPGIYLRGPLRRADRGHRRLRRGRAGSSSTRRRATCSSSTADARRSPTGCGIIPGRLAIARAGPTTGYRMPTIHATVRPSLSTPPMSRRSTAARAPRASSSGRPRPPTGADAPARRGATPVDASQAPEPIGAAAIAGGRTTDGRRPHAAARRPVAGPAQPPPIPAPERPGADGQPRPRRTDGQTRRQRLHGAAAAPVHQEPAVRPDARAPTPVRDQRRRTTT